MYREGTSLRLMASKSIMLFDGVVSDYFKSNLRAFWLMTAALSLVLPVFVPSFGWLNPFTNVIGMATALMFILSFPLSLLAAPITFLIDVLLGVDPRTIGGRYLSVCVMFVLGAVQWFWIAPRVWRGVQRRYTDELSDTTNDRFLNENESFQVANVEIATPLEKVIIE